MGLLSLDFETEAIDDRPRYPPRPVGLAIQGPGVRKYLAWGHRGGGNNCSFEDGRRAWCDALRSEHELLFHNSKFDQDVGATHFGTPLPDPRRVHDTMLLGYLDNPHARRLGLKELAHAELGIEPIERDHLSQWIFRNVDEARRAKKQWGRYIADAPASIVAPYAIQDANLNLQLFKHLYPKIRAAEMLRAYDRERYLIPILLRNETEGVRVDLPLLRHDVARYDRELERVDQEIRKILKAPGLNIDSNEDLADALERAKMVGEWLRTEKGQRSTSKESLKQALRNPRLIAILEYRATLSTCLTTFMRKWLVVAEETGGLVHFNWNSTKQPEENGGGTRTGRLSSSPNAQNIPTDENIEKAMNGVRQWKFRCLPLPHVRRYIIADSEEHVLCDRDFNQQELRVTAHYEGGAMRDAYLQNPKLDLHTYATELIKRNTGLALTRKTTKTLAFGLLYGMGVGKLAERLGVETKQAEFVRRAYLGTFPGLKEVMDDLKWRARNNEYMTTWGGRRYYAEPARIINGQLREFGYKLFNYLIQGSSADITKEAILRYDTLRRNSRLILTVHDEIMICALKTSWKREMNMLREAMHSIELDVPLLSDGEVGPRWFEMESCE